MNLGIESEEVALNSADRHVVSRRGTANGSNTQKGPLSQFGEHLCWKQKPPVEGFRVILISFVLHRFGWDLPGNGWQCGCSCGWWSIGSKVLLPPQVSNTYLTARSCHCHWQCKTDWRVLHLAGSIMRLSFQSRTQNPSHSTLLFKEVPATKLLKHSTTLAVGDNMVVLVMWQTFVGHAIPDHVFGSFCDAVLVTRNYLKAKQNGPYGEILLEPGAYMWQ